MCPLSWYRLRMKESSESGMSALGARIRAAREAKDKSRAQTGIRATQIAVTGFPGEDLIIDEVRVRDIETRSVSPSGDLRVLCCVLAAVDIPLVEALKILGLWPDLRPHGGRSVASSVAEAVRNVGYPDARLKPGQGRDIVIEI